MKALGVGIGGFRLPRRGGGPRATTGAPVAGLGGPAPPPWPPPRGVRCWHVSLTHTDAVAVAIGGGRGLSRLMRPVVHRGRDAGRRRRGPRHASTRTTLVDRAGTAVAAARPAPAGRRLRPPGGGGGRQGQQRRRRPGGRRPSCAGAAPGSRWSTRPTRPTGWPRRRVDLVIDAAYGTGFRGTYRGAGGAGRGARAGRRHPLGGRRRHRRGLRASPLRADVTVTFAALKPGLLQGDGARLAGRGRGGRHRARRRAGPVGVVEDADVARLLPVRRRETYKWQSAVAVVAGSPGHDGGGRALRRTPPTGPAPAWSASASPAGRPARSPGRRGGAACPARPRVGPTRSLAVLEPLPGPGGRARAWAGPRPPPARSADWWPAPRCRWWSTPTASCALGHVGRTAGRGARRPTGPGRAHPPRRRVRPAGRRGPRAPTGSPPPAAWPPRPARWSCSRGRRPRWSCPSRRRRRRSRPGSRPARPGWPPPGPATSCRGSSAPSWPGGSPRSRRPALAAHVHGRAAGLGPAEGLVAGDLADWSAAGSRTSPW